MNTVRRSGQMVVMVQGFNRSAIGSQENGGSVNERKEKKRKKNYRYHLPLVLATLCTEIDANETAKHLKTKTPHILYIRKQNIYIYHAFCIQFLIDLKCMHTKQIRKEIFNDTPAQK